MAAGTRSIVIRFLGDTAGLRKARQEGQEQLSGLQESFGNVGNFAERFGRDLEDSLDQLGGGIVKWARRGIVAGMAGVGAVAGLSLWSGLQRTLDTEDARRLFSQMGVGVRELDNLFGELQTTFERSSFAYPDVYNISSQLMASGVGLDRLDDTMRNVGNVTALTGKELSDVGDIFVKIAAEGQLSAMRLNQFATRGVNLAAILAEAAGKSEAEFRDMVSAGQVTNDMMHELLATAGMLDGAMDNMATTTRGAWNTLKAGLGGVGEALLAPWFGEDGTMVGFLNTINDHLFSRTIPATREWGEEIHRRLTPWVETFQDVLGNRLLPGLGDLVGLMRDNEEAARDLVREWGPAVLTTGALATAVHLTNRSFRALRRAGPIALVLGISKVFSDAYQESESMQESVGKLRDALLGTTELDAPVGGLPADQQAMADSEQTIRRGLLPALQELVVAIGELLDQDWEGFGDAVASGLDHATEGVNRWELLARGEFRELGGRLANDLREGIIDMTGGPDAFWGRMLGEGFAFQWEEGFWAGMWNRIRAEWSHQMDQLGADWSHFWRDILGLADGGWLQRLFTGGADSWGAWLNGISNDWDRFTGWLGSEWSVFWRSTLGLGEGGWLHRILFGYGDTWSGLWRGAGNTWSRFSHWLGGEWSSLWRGMWQTLLGWARDVETFVRRLPDSIRRWLGNLSNTLMPSGRELINGFMAGVRSALPSLSGMLQGVTRMLPDWKGPMSRDRRILEPSGAAVMAGFERGLESGVPRLRQLLGELTGDLPGLAFAGHTPAAPSAPPVNRGEFTGDLYLDSGEFLGKVRGVVREENRGENRSLKRRVGSGAGRSR